MPCPNCERAAAAFLRKWHRLSKAFGSAPEVWAGLQFDYDMAQAMKCANEIRVRRVPQPTLGGNDTYPANAI